MSDLKNIVLNGVSYDIDGSSGLTDDIKQALLACFQNVAWIDDDGQNYYDLLESCLFPDATISYITCSYAQSETVYTHTDINDLKNDLVVTAHWSDNTTTIVPSNQYTLSGTLAVGTSTVTVTFMQKTTTFNVVVTAGVPSTYTMYDYIKYALSSSTARGKAQWLQLKKYADLNTLSIEFKVAPLEYTGSQPAFMGIRSESGNTSSFAFYNSTTGTLGYHIHGTEVGGSTYTSGATQMNLGVPNTIKVTNNSSSPSTVQINDNDIITVPWTNSNVLNLALTLFSNPINDANATLNWQSQIGYIKVFDLSNNLIGHYFPVVEISTNQIGLYDVVEGIFYSSSTASYSTLGNSNCIYEVGNWS